MDWYFPENNSLSGFITSAIDITTVVANPLSAYLYETGNWIYTTLVFILFLLIPLICLQFIPLEKLRTEGYTKTIRFTEDSTQEHRADKILLKKQKITLLMPDLVVLVNNNVFIVVLSLPTV